MQQENKTKKGLAYWNDEKSLRGMCVSMKHVLAVSCTSISIFASMQSVARALYTALVANEMIEKDQGRVQAAVSTGLREISRDFMRAIPDLINDLDRLLRR